MRYSLSVLIGLGLLWGCQNSPDNNPNEQVNDPEITSRVQPDDRVSCAWSYLAYAGEEPPPEISEFDAAWYSYERMQENIGNVGVLSSDGKPQWEIVWGPAIQFASELFKDQVNMVMVVHNMSAPTTAPQYKVVVRGTNFCSLEDWKDYDLKVGTTVPWQGPDGQVHGHVSQATHNYMEEVFKLKPLASEISRAKLPGAGFNLYDYLRGIARQENVSIGFTGHSLGGAIAPTLATYFKERQGLPDGWDPNTHVRVTTTTFAGPTPGDKGFASHMDTLFSGGSYRRFASYYDVVPRAWNFDSFATVEDLYKSTGVEPMSSVEHDVYALLLEKVDGLGYQHAGLELLARFPVNTHDSVGTSWVEQVSYQHDVSYPVVCQVGEVIQIKRKEGGPCIIGRLKE